jgi:hypothetical protein
MGRWSASWLTLLSDDLAERSNPMYGRTGGRRRRKARDLGPVPKLYEFEMKEERGNRDERASIYSNEPLAYQVSHCRTASDHSIRRLIKRPLSHSRCFTRPRHRLSLYPLPRSTTNPVDWSTTTSTSLVTYVRQSDTTAILSLDINGRTPCSARQTTPRLRPTFEYRWVIHRTCHLHRQMPILRTVRVRLGIPQPTSWRNAEATSGSNASRTQRTIALYPWKRVFSSRCPNPKLRLDIGVGSDRRKAKRCCILRRRLRFGKVSCRDEAGRDRLRGRGRSYAHIIKLSF